MVSHLPVHPNGFGVCVIADLYSFFLQKKINPLDFVLSKITPDLNTALGYKLFLMFATINIGGLAVFSL